MAFSLLNTGKMRDALDFAREPAPVREAYGMTLFGQSCLAARRLVEAGAKFVTVVWDAYGLNAGSWDTHHTYCQVYAGGGMERGNAVGRTDKIAGDVADTPISPKDILATSLH